MARILYGLAGKDKTSAFSPHVWKIQMALAHKGLDYEFRAVSFLEIKEIEGGEFPTVPVLVDGDEKIIDSFNIARYLDETYKDKPSLMGGPAGISMTNFIQAWSNTQIHPAVAKVAMFDIYQMLDEDDQIHFRKKREAMFKTTLELIHEKREDNAHLLIDALRPLEVHLGLAPYLGGEHPIFADYIVFGALQWCRMCSTLDILPTEGKVADWFERLLDLHDGIGRKAPARI